MKLNKELKSYQEKTEKKNKIIPHRPSYLPILCASKNIRTILDFGGSNGWVFYYLKTFYDIKKIKKYTIVENKKVINFFKNKHNKFKKIEYKSFNQINHSYDVTYLNSVIQYINEEKKIINLIKLCNSKFLLFEDLLVGNFNDFYTNQLFYNDRIPVKFRNEKKFIKLVTNLGYKMILKKTYIAKIRGIKQPLPMNNLPKKYRLNYPSTILFENNIK